MISFQVYNALYDFVEGEKVSLPLACQQAVELAERYSYGEMGFIEVISPWGEILGRIERGDTFQSFLEKCIATINDR